MRKVNGVLQVQQADGSWVNKDDAPAQQEQGTSTLKDELDSLFSKDVGEATAPEHSHAKTRVAQKHSHPSTPTDGSGGRNGNETDVAELDIGEVPGLLSDEGPKSTSGKGRLQVLRDRVKGKRTGSRVTGRVARPRLVVVPEKDVQVEGPDAQGSRLSRVGPGRRSVPIKEAPSLLEDRPQWVKDLFEAHFRSELAYRLRHLPSGTSGKNRMKLSRADYAIGWLVMFDKAREDPGILRVKGGV
jgi:hypothetical protein